jgi:hypothetical protein
VILKQIKAGYSIKSRGCGIHPHPPFKVLGIKKDSGQAGMTRRSMLQNVTKCYMGIDCFQALTRGTPLPPMGGYVKWIPVYTGMTRGEA